MISIDESCLKCFDNFLNFNVSNHFVNKCVNIYHKRLIYKNMRSSISFVKVIKAIYILIVMRVLIMCNIMDRMLQSAYGQQLIKGAGIFHDFIINHHLFKG